MISLLEYKLVKKNGDESFYRSFDDLTEKEEIIYGNRNAMLMYKSDYGWVYNRRGFSCFDLYNDDEHVLHVNVYIKNNNHFVELINNMDECIARYERNIPYEKNIIIHYDGDDTDIGDYIEFDNSKTYTIRYCP